MAKEEVKLTDAEIAERGGMGSVPSDEKEEKDLTDTEEVDESEDEEESEDESKDEAKDTSKDADEESESKDDESEDKEDDADEDDTEESDEDESEKSEDESEEEDEDKEDDESDEEGARDRGSKRTVPYGKFKTERGKRQELQAEIDKLNKIIAKSRANKEGTDEDEELEEIDQTAEDLAKELGQDSKGLKKVLEAAVRLARKEVGDKALPKDLQEKLKLLDRLQADDKQKKEVVHFKGEWSKLLPELKKRFPNATDAMLAEAEQKMDEFSHSKKYHKYDLDYILFKKPKTFGTILTAAAGNRSGEHGKQMSTGGDDGGEEGEDKLVNIEDLTPEIMRARENKSTSRRKLSDDDSDVRVTPPLR